jgi:hypothetical protein
VSQQDNQLQPLPENPTPQDYGFPEKPSSADVQRWQRQELYLDALARTGSSGAASEESGVPVATARSWDFNDTHSFKRRREMALERFMGKVEAEIERRAIEGIDEPVYWRGQRVDTIKKYSDNLLMFRAKRLEPAYKDNYQPQQASTTINITRTVIEVRDYRNQGVAIEGSSREIPAEGPSQQVGEGDKSEDGKR